jgi:hypothetical protein
MNAGVDWRGISMSDDTVSRSSKRDRQPAGKELRLHQGKILADNERKHFVTPQQPAFY